MRRRVTFLANMPIVRPGELAHRNAGGNVRHSRETEIDAVRQDGGEERKLVVGRPTAAQMGKGVRKFRSVVNLKQKVSDADRRQTAFHL
ncbi:hypothetical protein GCM10023069_24020 [Shinella granuli]